MAFHRRCKRRCLVPFSSVSALCLLLLVWYRSIPASERPYYISQHNVLASTTSSSTSLTRLRSVISFTTSTPSLNSTFLQLATSHSTPPKSSSLTTSSTFPSVNTSPIQRVTNPSTFSSVTTSSLHSVTTPSTVTATSTFPSITTKPPSPPALDSKASSSSSHCSPVHVAMVASGEIASIQLYKALKSIFMHRSTPLHFHFITDERARTVLSAIVTSWLLPGVTHDYYDLHKVLIEQDSSVQCSKTFSIYSKLHSILPESVPHVIVIEPTSVVNLDLALLRSVAMSSEESPLSVCQEACVSYCSEVTDKDKLSRWGAISLRFSDLLDRSVVTSTLQGDNCLPRPGDRIDEAVIELANVSRNKKDMCEIVKSYDGELLRWKKMVECPKGLEPLILPPPPANKSCKHFLWEQNTLRREIPFIMGQAYSPVDEYDVALINHLDFNRLDLLERSLVNWDGPSSIGIQVTESQIDGVVKFILNCTSLKSRRNVTYHLLFKTGASYPINALREVAHRFSTTPYIFHSDIDYISSPGMYQAMRRNLRKIGSLHKVVALPPAFETDDTQFKAPNTKAGMVDLYENGTVRQFHVRATVVLHKQTNYTKWMTSTEPYYISWALKYEPYPLVHTSRITFDTRLIARFRNKVLFSAEAHMAGYKFLVLPDVYIVHLPHKKEKQNMDALAKCSFKWYTNWIHEKKKLYNYTENNIPDYYYKPNM